MLHLHIQIHLQEHTLTQLLDDNYEVVEMLAQIVVTNLLETI